MRTALLLLLLVCADGLANAQGQPKTATKSTTERLQSLEDRADGNDSSVDFLLRFTGNRSVLLDCDTHAFVAVMPTSNTMTFLAKCNSIEPYLEGFRLNIAIANPFTFEFAGVDGEIGYGETTVKTFSQRVKFSTVLPLRPGTWTAIQVTVNPAAAKDVRTIRLAAFDFGSAKVP